MGSRKKVMTLEDAFGHLKTMSAVYGVRMIEYPRGRRRLIPTLLHLVFIIAYCSYMFRLIPEEELDSDEAESRFAKVFYNITMFMDIGIILSCSIIGVYRSAMFDECIKKLSCVDKTLEKLGSPSNYKSFKRRTTFVLVGWVFFIVVSFILSLYWLLLDRPLKTALLIAFVYIRCLDVSGIIVITFIFTIRCLGDRFERLNELLRDDCARMQQSRTDYFSDIALTDFSNRTSVRDSYTVVENNSSPALLRKKCLIHTTRLLHFELRRAAKMVSIFFGMQIAVEIATCVLVMTGATYSLYHVVVDSTEKFKAIVFDVLMRYFYALVYAVKILILNLHCEKATCAANKTVDICFEMAFLIEDQDTKQEIEQFGLEARRMKFAITAFGAFPLDCCTLRSVFGTVITYLLILVQMG